MAIEITKSVPVKLSIPVYGSTYGVPEPAPRFAITNSTRDFARCSDSSTEFEMPVPSMSTGNLNSACQLLKGLSILLSAETIIKDSTAIAEAVTIPKNLEIE